ncbi:hypothetical protein LCGC14_2700800 [marine sediment metagenome]|uniref:Uncharacterized protein n=1 Tax=marine sediment metagenome TaxID=412755 RepID=A0A0F9A3D7_9ZZZZ
MQLTSQYSKEQESLTDHERAYRAWVGLCYIINTMCLKEGELKVEVPFFARPRLLTKPGK